MGDSWEPHHASDLQYDVLIIGAGLSGIYSLFSMKALGLRVKVLERGPEVGGVWYWNCYPGARLDSESYTYAFTFSKEICDGWEWKEHYSAQPDTLRYINYVVDKFAIRDDFILNTEVKSATWQAESRSWLLTDHSGTTYSTRFLINALGPLTTPTVPDIPGLSNFKGLAYHTSRWPRHPVSFEGKNVGVIGVGATGIQTIQEVAKTAGNLTVFQRTPNWTLPMRNKIISKEEMNDLRNDYDNIYAKCQASAVGFMYSADPRNTFDVSKEEREAFWEDLYARPGLIKWIGNFKDAYTNQQANDEYSRWMAEKIRQRVHDPATAEKLIPKNHGFGLRRVPLENGYYELFNQPQVHLVDLHETPIESVTESGIRTSTDHIDLDVLIFATGFDALTGSYEEISYHGENNQDLKDKWADGPRTYLGLTVVDFPNMFNVLGPHQATGNVPHSIEFAVQWVTKFMRYLVDNGINYFNATEEGEQWWTDHVRSLAEPLLATKVDSWMTGVNSNRAGKQHRRVIRYCGSNVEYRKRANQVAADEYKAFVLKN